MIVTGPGRCAVRTLPYRAGSTPAAAASRTAAHTKTGAPVMNSTSVPAKSAPRLPRDIYIPYIFVLTSGHAAPCASLDMPAQRRAAHQVWGLGLGHAAPCIVLHMPAQAQGWALALDSGPGAVPGAARGYMSGMCWLSSCGRSRK